MSIRSRVLPLLGAARVAIASRCAAVTPANMQSDPVAPFYRGRMLSIPEKLAMLLPPSWYYRRRIAYEVRTGAPELGILRELVGGGGTAIDVGANQGFFAYALGEVADRVLAFEPNPDYAWFARWMLRGRAEVHEVALSDHSGRGTFHVPFSEDGKALHLAGSLNRTHAQFAEIRYFEVETRKLDDYGFPDVRFVKIDVEGSEREVLDGSRVTIERNRPVLLLELLSGTFADPARETGTICESFGYEAFLLQGGRRIAALPAIAKLGKNTSWGTEIESRNVLFLPRRSSG
jgi:FkbM family methyltransferase